MQSGEMHKYRTHTCGELRGSDTGSDVRLSGWLRNRRDHGGVYFIDLADHYGITQLVVEPGTTFYDRSPRLPKETVIRVDGKVVARDAGTINPAMPTGEIEVRVTDAELLGPTEPLPFNVFPESAVPEDLRLTYRFLDLREIEDARQYSAALADYCEHSAAHGGAGIRGISDAHADGVESGRRARFSGAIAASSGKVLRAAAGAADVQADSSWCPGFDRYFQIAPCYRDEDSRADRSPGEFYQLDLEMSFVTQDDVFAAVEALLDGPVCGVRAGSPDDTPRRFRASLMPMPCCATAPISRTCAIRW